MMLTSFEMGSIVLASVDAIVKRVSVLLGLKKKKCGSWNVVTFIPKHPPAVQTEAGLPFPSALPPAA